MGYAYLGLSTVDLAAKHARKLGVSEVARSSRGFVTAYRRAGSASNLSDHWRRKRDNFVARHMAQVKKRREKLWKDGKPTRRHLALVMWAYSPDAAKLGAWLRRNSGGSSRRSNPDPLTVLAAGSALAYDLAVARELDERRKNPTLLLASNPIGKRKRKLGPPRKTGRMYAPEDPQDHYNSREFQAAREQYKKFFYGDEPMEVIPIEAPPGTPKYLVSLGRAPEVTYKPPDHTSKKGVPFVHEFGEEGGEEPFLATDPDGEWLGYIGGTWAITPDGIRN